MSLRKTLIFRNKSMNAQVELIEVVQKFSRKKKKKKKL